MAIGLGSLIGGAIGGVGGFFATGGNPYGALAGFSAGTSFGANFDEVKPTGNPEADRMRAEQMRLAKEQQVKWDARYGKIEEKLARSISNMTVESVSALGLQAVEQEFEKVGVSLRQNLAGRNLSGSGIEQALSNQTSIAKAEAKASIRAEAPDKILDRQSSFLRLGLGSQNRETTESRLLGQSAVRSDAAFQNELNRKRQQQGDAFAFAGELLGSQDIKLRLPDFNSSSGDRDYNEYLNLPKPSKGGV